MWSRCRVLGMVTLASLLLAAYNGPALLLWLGAAPLDKITGPIVGESVSGECWAKDRI